MKKKMLAILLSAAMVICMMPTMAFAIEEPVAETKEEVTEEVKEEVTEEVNDEVAEEVKEEATEEKVEEAAPAVEQTAVEPVEEVAPAEEQTAELSAEPEETAELNPEGGGEEPNSYTLTGSWDGYKFSYTKKDNQAYTGDDVHTTKIRVDGELTDIKLENGVYDFTEVVNSVFANGASYCNIHIYTDQTGESGELVNIADFYKLDVTVQVDKAASKDTTFVYDVPFALVNDTSEGNVLLKKVETGEALNSQITENAYKENTQNVLVSNSIVLKAGSKVQSGYLVYRHSEGDDEETFKYATPTAVPTSEVIGFLITEKSNDGGYATNTSVWAGIFKDLFAGKTKDDYEEDDVINFYKNGFKYSQFADMAAVDAEINELNTNDKTPEQDFAELGATLFTNDQATFVHTSEAANEDANETTKKSGKGVGTSDSNELGLWLTLGMFASVAAAAYALKRRENQ